PETARGLLVEQLEELDRQLADLGVGVLGAAQADDVAPGAGIAGDDHLDLGGVRQDRASGLKGLLAPISATDQLLGERLVRIQCVLYGVVEYRARRVRVLRDQRWGDDPLRVVLHVALADHREAQVAVPLQLGEQRARYALHVEGEERVL